MNRIGRLPVIYGLRPRGKTSWYASVCLVCLTFLLTFFGPLGCCPSLAATIEVSGGISPGFLNHTFENPELLFTWTGEIQVSGSGWAPPITEDVGPVEVLLR